MNCKYLAVTAARWRCIAPTLGNILLSRRKKSLQTIRKEEAQKIFICDFSLVHLVSCNRSYEENKLFFKENCLRCKTRFFLEVGRAGIRITVFFYFSLSNILSSTYYTFIEIAQLSCLRSA